MCKDINQAIHFGIALIITISVQNYCPTPSNKSLSYISQPLTKSSDKKVKVPNVSYPPQLLNGGVYSFDMAHGTHETLKWMVPEQTPKWVWESGQSHWRASHKKTAKTSNFIDLDERYMVICTSILREKTHQPTNNNTTNLYRCP